MELTNASEGAADAQSRKRQGGSGSYGTGMRSPRDERDADDARDSDSFLRRGTRTEQARHFRARGGLTCTGMVGIAVLVLMLMSYVHYERVQHLRAGPGVSTTTTTGTDTGVAANTAADTTAGTDTATTTVKGAMDASERAALLETVLGQLAPLRTLETRRSVDGELNTTINVDQKRVTDGPIAFWTRAYEDSTPGPLLLLKPGDVVNIHQENRLGPNTPGEWAPNTMHHPNNTNLHFHGMHVDPTGAEDNVFRVVAPGESADTRLHVPWNHPRGLFHYHAHYHGSVFLQMGGGMAGPIVVEDDPATVPAEFAAMEQKHVLVLSEFRFIGGLMSSLVDAAEASRSTLDMDLTYTDKIMLESQVRQLYPDVQKPQQSLAAIRLPEELKQQLLEDADDQTAEPRPPVGMYFAVNGQYLPKIEIKPRENFLLRMVHTGGTATLELELPGCTMQLSASDGLNLPKPRPMSTVILSPGARVDIILNCEPSSENGAEPLRPLQSTKQRNLQSFVGKGTDVYSGVLAFVHVSGESMEQPLIPAVPPPPPLYGDNSLLELSEEDKAGMDPIPFRFEFSMGTPQRKDGYMYKNYYINNQLFDGTSIRTMTLGRVQEWVVMNEHDQSGAPTAKNHPFHLHTNAFQIIDASHDLGVDYEVGDWRDVILVPTPGNVTIRFRPVDFTGIVAAHCHILGHSDAGMIAAVDMISGD